MTETNRRPAAIASSRSRILLVAHRELRERMRTKAFKIGTALVVLAAVALATVPGLIDTTNEYEVGVVGRADGFAAAFEAVAEQRETTATITTYDTIAEAEAALRDGSVEVVYDTGAGQLVWEEDPSTSLGQALQQAAATVALQRSAVELSLTPQQVQQLVAPPSLGERSLDPPDPDRPVRVATAMAGTIVLFIAIQMAGGFVLSGVVEEKSSRIVEILLSQVPPYQLLAGKVIGIGTLAFVQLVAVVGAAYLAGTLSGTLDSGTVAIGAAVVVVAWFVLGFAFYAVGFAAAGSLVNRMEDAQSVSFPIMAPLLLGYGVAFAAVDDPGMALARWLSLFPPTAPVLMPLRMQLGSATAVEVVVAVVLMLAATYGLIRVGGRVYSGAVLRSGGRVKVADALRAGRDVTP